MTAGHPSTQPRLVKEADALAEAGYRVRVVATKLVAWADTADREFEDRPWSDVAWARIGPFAAWPQRQAMRLRRRLLRPLAWRAPQLSPRLATLAFHDAVPQLIRHAIAEPADLYIAHNLAALAAAHRAAEVHGARLGFDAEDFHRGELEQSRANRRQIRLTAALENFYIPRCDYVTAGSDGIALAYARALAIDPPVTILNAFPLADRHRPTAAECIARERQGPELSLYWFSQTIGPHRGLEGALQAMARLGPAIRLHVRGTWATGYQEWFMAEAKRLGLGGRVHHLPPVPPGELIARSSRHDVGLALESGDRINSNLMTTNKILTYFVAGLAIAATDTEGQRTVMARAPGAGLCYPRGDVAALAAWLEQLIAAPARLEAARRAALAAAQERFCWEKQKLVFTHLIADIMARAPRLGRPATRTGAMHR